MAEIVGTYGVPHNPHFPVLAATDDPLGAEVRRLFGGVSEHLQAGEPDVVLFFTSDHYNIFFGPSVPIFSIGVADSAVGPSDYPHVPRQELAIDTELARHLQSFAVGANFDVGMSQEFDFDHTVTSPLHFLTPGYAVPVVPIFVSGFLRPIPSARRCYELGKALREGVAAFGGDRRVAVVASGSFSLEIGGPRMFPDHHTGVPDPKWLDRILGLLADGDHEQLVSEATDAQLWQAGNAGGELLDWMVMLGMADEPRPPEFLDVQPRFGHAFAAWPTPKAKVEIA
jgi:protocatechuate 4,5-dioxygenase beta chain